MQSLYIHFWLITPILKKNAVESRLLYNHLISKVLFQILINPMYPTYSLTLQRFFTKDSEIVASLSNPTIWRKIKNISKINTLLWDLLHEKRIICLNNLLPNNYHHWNKQYNLFYNGFKIQSHFVMKTIRFIIKHTIWDWNVAF